VIARAWRHPWVRHLRLPFNLLLSPIFLWGVWLGGGADDPLRVAVAYLALHVFLYGGTNALNSFYDRDEGPIGGMLRPPPIDRGLLAWAWGVQLAGLPLAAWVGGPFLAVWVALLGVATAYSHPRWRWKSHPLAAVAAVGLGQGGLGALAGAWAVADPARGWGVVGDLLQPGLALGLAAAATLVPGLYVVSQIYQTREDRARGDRTWPVLLGPAAALRWATLVSAVGGVLLLAAFAGGADGSGGLGWAALLPLGVVLAVLAGAQWRWAARFDEDDVEGNFRRAMAMLGAGSVVLTLFLLAVALR
jgi:1,4-dihydroxy-2-naphthoate octaprenyltransferase